MVYTPRAYLVSAAVALLAAQTAATSLFYDPAMAPGTTNKIGGKFPGRGTDVPDQDVAITVEVDPTLPNITTISPVPVTYPDLLANLTTAPAEPVSTKVGTAVVTEPLPAVDADQDAYIGGSIPSTPVTTPATKAGITTSSSPNGKDCATGWENTKTGAKIEKKRRLEANANKDIAKLEAYFGTSMETTLKNLPTQCVHTPSPWPGPYWPTYQDSINVVWSEGQPSAAEKYAKAFGLDVTDFMDKVSKDNGIDSMSNRQKCTTDNDCSNLTDGSACAIRAGKTSGYCIPTWFGICHAWTPASILEAEPNCPVTHNGVTFQPMDLKALISDIYDGAKVSAVFTGTRFNGGADTPDEYGRHSSDSYRDVNPAFLHIAATNILGKLNATFIADVTAGAEVWNQPVRGFKVYEQTTMSLEEAAQTFYGLETYPWNAAAKSIVYVKSRLSWVYETYTDGGLVSSGQVDKFTTGAYYTYLLEMDDAGAIIGGEWVYKSDDDHVDFIWFPKAKPAADTVTSVGLSYADVSMLLAKSVACSDSSTSASGSVGSAGSASASTTSSTAASTSGSSAPNATSSEEGSASAGSAAVPATSTAASDTGSNGATPAGTPAATFAGVGSSAVPTESASSNQGGNHDDHHHEDQGDHHQNDDHHQDDNDDHNQQQQQQRQQQQWQQEGHGQRQWYQSFFHWG